jgi:threonine/homoserine/homoserine lactone efflux protein
MTLQTWLLYVAAVAVLTVTPGPAVLMSVSSGMRHGVRRTFVSVLGNITALCIIMTVSAIGLGATLAASEKFFQAIKWLGVAYLIYVGIKTFRSQQSTFDVADESASVKRIGLLRLYANGFLIGASNPKALLFFTAFFPQFINPAAPQVPQFLALVATFVVFEMSCLMLYANFASRAAPWLRKPGRATMFNRLCGATFVGAGALLSTVKRG